MRDRRFALRPLGNSRECIYVVGSHQRIVLWIYVVGSHQRIVLWNAGAVRETGYSADEVLGRHCYQVIGGMRGEHAYCHAGCSLQRAVSRGALPESVKLQIRTKAGRCLWCRISFIVLESVEGPLIVHVSRDVSASERRDAALGRIFAELRQSGLCDGSMDPSEKEGPDSRDWFPTQLTPREIDILRLLADGLSTKAISERLFVSMFTVRSHIEHALLKSGLHSRTEAVAAAFRAGILSPR
jgi:PAS domain S-box-containing protein